jgi:hypothetical protein
VIGREGLWDWTVNPGVSNESSVIVTVKELHVLVRFAKREKGRRV